MREIKKYIIDLDKKIKDKNKTTTTVYAYAGYVGMGKDETYVEPIKFDTMNYCRYNVFAEFKIVHSKMLVGIWEDNIHYFYEKCMELLEENGFVIEGENGFKYLVDNCLDK